MRYNLFSQLVNKRVFLSSDFEEAKKTPEGDEATNTVLNLRRTFDFAALKTFGELPVLQTHELTLLSSNLCRY